MSPIDKLVHIFKLFPGIGERQAKRFVYFLLSRDKDFLTKFQTALGELTDDVAQCALCKRFYAHLETQGERCAICADASRDASLLMIVEKDTDLENVESSNVFKGRYFVLGGTPSLQTNDLTDAEHLRAAALTEYITEFEPSEIILGFATNNEGEHTSELVTEFINAQKFKHDLTISKLGRGLSAGAELEYADPSTLKAAFNARTN